MLGRKEMRRNEMNVKERGGEGKWGKKEKEKSTQFHYKFNN